MSFLYSLLILARVFGARPLEEAFIRSKRARHKFGMLDV